ncbi:conserved Plasmodium protein, unknown function [Plasmodium ovale curtisi]|uniref:CS domain-containing protein n=1 Tax=Plasmodium ovale curtisi TaxID=864141 RepID=A0A1A8X274_PLAOA|nr:conserved Plasmodium protein, unknown function [Plasmodium ovale curtisi]
MYSVILCILLSMTIFSTQTLQKQIPTVWWGQTSNKLTLFVSMPSITMEEVKFTENNVHLSAKDKQGENVEFNFDFLRPITPEECSYTSSGIGLKLNIQKKTKPCWKRLTKEDKKINFLMKNKNLGDANDCEAAKTIWLWDYMFYIRKINEKKKNRITIHSKSDDLTDKLPKHMDKTQRKNNRTTKTDAYLTNLVEELKTMHSNFTLYDMYYMKV